MRIQRMGCRTVTNLNVADLTLLDRLIDENPRSTTEPVHSPSEWERLVRESVQHDIANLLNSRSWLGTWPRELELLRFSILNCGLPDMSGAAIDNREVQHIISQTVRMALEVFEPRLKNIHVVVSNSMGERRARILISAEFRGTSETVLFRRVVGRRTLNDLTEAPT